MTENKVNRPVTVLLTRQEWAYVKEKLPDVSISRYIRRLLLESVGYNIPAPKN